MGAFENIGNIIKNTWKTIEDNNNAVSNALANISEYTEKMNYADIMVNNPKVLAEHLLHKEPISASITIPVRNYADYGATGYTATIPFYMSGDFGLGLHNSWEEALDLSQLKELAKFINVGHATIGHGEAQVSMQSEAMSTKVWSGSTFDGFDVDCLFVCTNRKFNTLKILNNLAATCLPTRLHDQSGAAGAGIKNIKAVAGGVVDIVGELINGFAGFVSDHSDFDTSGAQQAVSNGATGFKQYLEGMGMIAPLNYGLQKGTEGSAATEEPLPNTTVTLQVGSYFRANNLLVQDISGIVLSKEIVAPPTDNSNRKGDLYDNLANGSDSGFPLYLKCHLKLVPHSLMHFNKWQSYFLVDTDYKQKAWLHDYPLGETLQLPGS